MRVYLTSAYPDDSNSRYALSWLVAAALLDCHGQHLLCYDPHEADIIIFIESHTVDPYYTAVRRHALRRQFPSRTFLYHDNDAAFPLVPGVYPSVKRSDASPEVCSGGQYLARLQPNDHVDAAGFAGRPEPDLACSFIGSINSKVRHDLLDLKGRDGVLVHDTNGTNNWQLDPVDRKKFEAVFVTTAMRSRFILCPRGIGPSTYRLFESLKLGVAPVVISDEFCWPPHLPWRDFAVTVAEADVAALPDLLAGLPWREMGVAARLAHDDFLSDEHAFHYLVESCALISARRRKGAVPHSNLFDLLRSDQGSSYLRYRLRAIRQRLVRL